jgi:heat shock protein 4
MSVVGIDLGTLNSVIAVARNRGVDVVSTRASAIVFQSLTPPDRK